MDDEWRRWWIDDGTVTYTQFMAKDNIPFHTISFPATVLGTEKPWKLVDELKGFNWLTYYGGKFSTSQQRGVFMDTALDIAPADVWRYTLLANAPESSDSDFTWETLAIAVNKDLVGAFGNFVNRTLKFATERCEPLFNSRSKNGEVEHEFEAAINASLKELRTHFDNLQFRKAMQELRNLWSLGNSYIDRTAPWRTLKLDQNEAARQVHNAVQMIEVFAFASFAVMPNTAARVLSDIGCEPKPTWKYLDLSSQAEYRIAPDRPVLFNKIEQEQIETLKMRFGQ